MWDLRHARSSNDYIQNVSEKHRFLGQSMLSGCPKEHLGEWLMKIPQLQAFETTPWGEGHWLVIICSQRLEIKEQSYIKKQMNCPMGCLVPDLITDMNFSPKRKSQVGVLKDWHLPELSAGVGVTSHYCPQANGLFGDLTEPLKRCWHFLWTNTLVIG